ncbi:MAG TPA: hypothetical protein VFS32_09275 [Candidatus Limnocylindrales bacterium]|nr:hypothetical protein [Candidatus Limnocylindrales bacterium]
MIAPARSVAARALALAVASALLVGCAGDVAIADSVPASAAPSASSAAAAAAAGTPRDPGPGRVPATGAAPTRETDWESTASRPSATPHRPRFAMDLFEPDDFVGQYTFEWCVGASLQMALLVTDRTNDRSRAFQAGLWRAARDASDSPFGGANPIGWTATLDRLGIGPYELVSRPTLDGALETAAAAIRRTRRPVGLVMWSGRHAWVMTGFESRGDPRHTEDFEVTGVRVLDPLYPHGSRIWGRSPRPDALIAPGRLGRQFVPRLFGRIDYGVPPGYVLVLPTT